MKEEANNGDGNDSLKLRKMIRLFLLLAASAKENTGSFYNFGG